MLVGETRQIPHLLRLVTVPISVDCVIEITRACT